MMLTAIVNDAAGAAKEVLLSVAPLAAVLIVAQVLFLRLSGRQFGRMMAGLFLVLAGLMLFLTGVRFAIEPLVREIGTRLLGEADIWALIPLGILLGFATAAAEPSVRVLSDQVEETTGGAIRATLVTVTVAAGVSILVAVAMVRTVYQIPLLWILVPGYALAVVLSLVTPSDFVAIALDAGGVVTGPMIVTFVLGLVLSIAGSLPAVDVLEYGFGLVAHVALAPILSLLVLGIVFERRRRNREEETYV